MKSKNRVTEFLEISRFLLSIILVVLLLCLLSSVFLMFFTSSKEEEEMRNDFDPLQFSFSTPSYFSKTEGYQCSAKCVCTGRLKGELKKGFGIRKIQFSSSSISPDKDLIMKECSKEMSSECPNTFEIDDSQTECIKEEEEETEVYECGGYCVPKKDVTKLFVSHHGESHFQKHCKKFGLEIKSIGSTTKKEMKKKVRDELSLICGEFWNSFVHKKKVKGRPSKEDDSPTPCYEGKSFESNVWCNKK